MTFEHIIHNDIYTNQQIDTLLIEKLLISKILVIRAITMNIYGDKCNFKYFLH